MRTMKRIAVIALMTSICLVAFGFQSKRYEITRASDGPFSISVGGIAENEGSSLQRESILFNDPGCPAQITGHSTSIKYNNRGLLFVGETKLELSKDIQAIEIRTALYDVFGMHIHTLLNTQARDFSAGSVVLNSEWRASENDISAMLTTATYVSRVRYFDGTQWVFDKDQLELAVGTLELEKVVEDEE